MMKKADTSPVPNYDEGKVPAYALPELLVMEDGTPVGSASAWTERRRPELLRLFEENVYGKSCGRPEGLSFKVVSKEGGALSGLATRMEVEIRFKAFCGSPCLNLLLYIPNGAKKPVPAFLSLNFYGNHALSNDPGIRLPAGWVRDKGEGVVNSRAIEKGRGTNASAWPLETIMRRGFAVGTIYYGDMESDHRNGWKEGGIRGALSPDGAKTCFGPSAWGAIGAWSWGLSRALDFLESVDSIDAAKVATIGHSRLGKTALWAAAQDTRFAMAVSNNSGCGGAALSRRCFGETVATINTSFPHWFCGRFKDYNNAEEKLPVDQHELIALLAPRPVYVASAEEDKWADPKGEFLSALHAEPAYRLFGKGGLGVKEMPQLNVPVGDSIGYHIRPGAHAIVAYDWDRYLDFAARHFGV